MLAAVQGSEATVRILLNAGAEPRLRNNKREQARNLAEAAGNARVMLLLDQHASGNKWTPGWF
jgi:ankyrin repeat protein